MFPSWVPFRSAETAMAEGNQTRTTTSTPSRKALPPFYSGETPEATQKRALAGREKFLLQQPEILSNLKNSSIAHSTNEQHNISENLLQEVGDCFDKATCLMEEVQGLLRGEGRISRQKTKDTFNQLTILLHHIQGLTNQFYPDAPVSAEIPAATLKEYGGKRLDVKVEEGLTNQCFHVLNALAQLADAVEWAKIPKSYDTASVNNYPRLLARPLTLNEISEVAVHAAFATTQYNRTVEENLAPLKAIFSMSFNPSHLFWMSMPIPPEVLEKYRETCPNAEVLEDDRIHVPDSRMTGQIFANSEAERIVIALGGTFTGPAKGTFPELFKQNHSRRQFRANLSTATGVYFVGSPVPDSTLHATELTRLLKDFFSSSPQYANWKISLTGHSKGGVEVEYSGAKNKLQVICFGTPALGWKVRETLSAEEKEWADRNTLHCWIKGDPVSTPRLWQSHLGVGFTIEPTKQVGNGWLRPFKCHSLFYRSVLEYGNRQLKLMS